VAATNRNLEAEVAAGRFRQDLLFRLNTHQVKVPPLRERLSDVPLLAEHFLQLTCEKFGMKPRTLEPEALGALKAYDWARNNIRELRNVIERLVIAGQGEVITADLIPSEIRGGQAPALDLPAGGPVGTLKDLKAAAERQIILAALERNDWHITNTAAQLGLADHSSLLKIMRRHDMKK
jgi:DNA-binding NtrC family response regulator